MPNTINKVVFENRTLIDLTGDTVSADKMFKGTTAHGANGNVVTGTAEVTVSGETLVMPEGLITPL